MNADNEMPRRKNEATDVRIGQNIRFHRMSRHATQAELAHEIGVSQQQLRKYENGTDRIAASRLFEVSQILHVPIEAFFREIPPSLRKLPPLRSIERDEFHR
ncbi:MAG: helix-turn-helix transcriptional regulator [Alphaproteobacteria bacterium]